MAAKKPQPRPVRNVTLDGFQAALIPLKGKNARGRMLILDRDVSDWLRTEYGNPWTLYESHGREFVGGALRPAGRKQRRGVVNKRVSLARLIMGAGAGQAVRTRSGNCCDLRRANLKVVRCGANRPRPTVPLSSFIRAPRTVQAASGIPFAQAAA